MRINLKVLFMRAGLPVGLTYEQSVYYRHTSKMCGFELRKFGSTYTIK